MDSDPGPARYSDGANGAGEERRKGGGPPIPFSACPIPKSKRVTFYDQVHTVGTDIKQDKKARAALTLAKGMLMRDVAQGAWRMRQLAKGQTIVYFVSPETKNLIAEDRRRFEEQLQTKGRLEQGFTPERFNPNQRDIIRWLLHNSKQAEGVQRSALINQRLNDVARSSAMNFILANEPTADRSNLPYSSLLQPPIHQQVADWSQSHIGNKISEQLWVAAAIDLRQLEAVEMSRL